MKITSYIPPVCVVALVYLGYNYASNQTTTMRMLVDARTGFTDEPGGLALANKSLETEAATVAKRRADALKANQEALVLTNKAEEDLASATSVMETHKAARDEVLARIEEGEATFAEVKAENEKILAAMHNIPALSSADISEALGIVENYVKDFNTDYDRISSDLEKKTNQREELGKLIGELTVDLANKRDTNKRFLDNYRRNDREFTIEAVDPRWHFVIFEAGDQSSHFIGDSEPLLVKRGGAAIASLRIVSVSGGKVVAEYDEKTLAPGVQLEIGDRIIRKKPFGS